VPATDPASPTLFLVRHGQASLGSDDYDRLSERGHRQAVHVAGRFESHLAGRPQLWSGTLRRHRQTLSPLTSAREASVWRTADLDEFSTGGLVRAALRHADRLGLAVPPREQLADPVVHLDRLLAWFPAVLSAWQEAAFEDEEVGTWAAFLERVMRPAARWADELAAGRSVIVVTSAGVIATLAASLSGQALSWQRSLAVRLYNASVTELTLAEGAWRLGRFNCTRHLEAEGLRTLA
jgi:broad specificity phosphatase PhoE